MSRCRVCPALIVWATSTATGTPMPLDQAPSLDGTMHLTREDGKLFASFMPEWERKQLIESYLYRRDHLGEEVGPLPLHVEHHATCEGARRVDAGELVGQETLF